MTCELCSDCIFRDGCLMEWKDKDEATTCKYYCPENGNTFKRGW